MRTLIWCSMLCFLLQAPFLRPADGNTYRNEIVGFSITKPATWFFETKATADEARSSSELPVKLVMITRYKEPYPDLNASVTISCVSREKVAVTLPKTLARILVNRMEEHVDNFVVQEGPSEVTVAGLKGAYARAFFDVKSPEGARIPASAEVWVLIAGDLFYIVRGESKQDEKTGSRKELLQILETIKIDAKETSAPTTSRRDTPNRQPHLRNLAY